MNKWKNSIDNLTRIGIEAVEDIPDHVINFLKNADIKKPEYSNNNQLAGHIKEEYEYANWPVSFEKYLLSTVATSNILNDYTNNISILSESRPFYLDKLWCNFQKKYEFNPLHDHSGLFSFIIFLQIPYNLDDEDVYFPKSNLSEPKTSRLCFIQTNNLGKIFEMPVNVDKSFENKMLIFPAVYNHLVYPFFTSDDYRITVSGNIKLKV